RVHRESAREEVIVEREFVRGSGCHVRAFGLDRRAAAAPRLRDHHLRGISANSEFRLPGCVRERDAGSTADFKHVVVWLEIEQFNDEPIRAPVLKRHHDAGEIAEWSSREPKLGGEAKCRTRLGAHADRFLSLEPAWWSRR